MARTEEYVMAAITVGDVLVCVDFSAATREVVDAGARLARALGTGMHLLHVAAPEPDLVGYDTPGGPRDRRDRAGELRAEHAHLSELAASVPDLAVIPLLVMGATAEVILAEARRLESELVVVGSHGHGGLRRLLVGSTTDALLRRADRPVVVVPTRG